MQVSCKFDFNFEICWQIYTMTDISCLMSLNRSITAVKLWLFETHILNSGTFKCWQLCFNVEILRYLIIKSLPVFNVFLGGEGVLCVLNLVSFTSSYRQPPWPMTLKIRSTPLTTCRSANLSSPRRPAALLAEPNEWDLRWVCLSSLTFPSES